MGEGETAIEGYLDSADTRSTLARGRRRSAPRSRASRTTASSRRSAIDGVGLRGAAPGRRSTSATPAPCCACCRAGSPGRPGGAWTLDGDDSIRRRPVDRIADAAAADGRASSSCREERLPPLRIEGAPLRGIDYELPVASAQVKSCLLFAGLLAEGETRIVEPPPSRDHTERMLAAAGAEVEPRAATRSSIAPGRAPASPGEIVVPGDFSSAAFFIVAALLVPGSEVALTGVGLNPTRTGLLDPRADGGRDRGRGRAASAAASRAATLRVARAPSCAATEVGGAEVPLAIDELPLVALAACFAEGETTIRDAAELRRKESRPDRDRLRGADRARRRGRGRPRTGWSSTGTGGLRGGTVDSHGDHRIAMLGAVAGLASREGVEVEGMDAAAVSYPGFEADLAALAGGGTTG